MHDAHLVRRLIHRLHGLKADAYRLILRKVCRLVYRLMRRRIRRKVCRLVCKLMRRLILRKVCRLV